MTLIVTGASGFVGRAIAAAAGTADVVAVPSARHGGPQLEALDGHEQLERFVGPQARGAVLVHAAARVDLQSRDALVANAAMASTVSRWAEDAGITHAVLVSSVSVLPFVPDADAGGQPRSFYGLGKLAAEEVWKMTFAADRSAIVRMSGVWGWQERPTLFWNRLLLAAACGTSGRPLTVKRTRSFRNYVSASDAAAALILIARSGISGTLTLAGRDTVSLGMVIDALRAKPGSRLEVDVQDDGGEDRSVYTPSVEFVPALRPFEQGLQEAWTHRPEWLSVLCASA